MFYQNTIFSAVVETTIYDSSEHNCWLRFWIDELEWYKINSVPAAVRYVKLNLSLDVWNKTTSTKATVSSTTNVRRDKSRSEIYSEELKRHTDGRTGDDNDIVTFYRVTTLRAKVRRTHRQTESTIKLISTIFWVFANAPSSSRWNF